MQALTKSGLLCQQMLAEALASLKNGKPGRVRGQKNDAHPTKFLRDGWARPWPPGAAMFAYMITHEAHHRGQVCMLAHQLGYPLLEKATYGMWDWEKMWKERGFGGPS